MGSSLSWLHFSDLHAGMRGLREHGPAVLTALDEDLRFLAETAGPFDLILFSGDLAFSGKPEQYQQVNEVLELLIEALHQAEPPVLLAVPGNHDLVWQDSKQPEVRVLKSWAHDRELADRDFWDPVAGRRYLEPIERAFAHYLDWQRAWYERHPLPADRVEIQDQGLLPGDQVATVHSADGQLTLGLAGLNSAFLAIAGDAPRGGLAVSPLQLNTLCGGSPLRWASRHSACLLMTHHPPEWLEPPALANYQGAIFLPQWFAGHLFGHMHEPLTQLQATSGGPLVRRFQAPSLFGVETWQDERGQQTSRLHGYTAVRLSREAKTRGELRLWPRLARPNQSGQWEVVPDYPHFSLEGRTNSFVLPFTLREIKARTLSRPPGHARPAGRGVAPTLTEKPAGLPSPASEHTGGSADQPSGPGGAELSSPQPPGFRYDPAWTVPRPQLEQRVLNGLRNPGTVVIIKSPPRFGASTFLRRLIDLACDEPAATPGQLGTLGVAIGLAAFAEDSFQQPAVFLRELAEQLVRTFAQTTGRDPTTMEGWVEEAWKRPGTPERRLTALMERRILRSGAERIILALDRIDFVIGRKSGDALVRMLRSWMEDHNPIWSTLRLLLAAPGGSLIFEREVDAVSEFFNIALEVRLEPFSLEETRALAGLYRQRWSKDELKRVHELVGGHPFFIKHIFFLDASGIPRTELLDQEQLKTDHCTGLLRQLYLYWKNMPEVMEPMSLLLREPETRLNPEQYMHLREAGLVRKVEKGKFQFVMPLIESYLREQLGLEKK